MNMEKYSPVTVVGVFFNVGLPIDQVVGSWVYCAFDFFAPVSAPKLFIQQK